MVIILDPLVGLAMILFNIGLFWYIVRLHRQAEILIENNKLLQKQCKIKRKYKPRKKKKTTSAQSIAKKK